MDLWVPTWKSSSFFRASCHGRARLKKLGGNIFIGSSKKKTELFFAVVVLYGVAPKVSIGRGRRPMLLLVLLLPQPPPKMRRSLSSSPTFLQHSPPFSLEVSFVSVWGGKRRKGGGGGSLSLMVLLAAESLPPLSAATGGEDREERRNKCEGDKFHVVENCSTLRTHTHPNAFLNRGTLIVSIAV